MPAGLRRTVRLPLVIWRERSLRTNDTLLVSYPKSGTTWLRFLLVDALTGTDPEFDSIRCFSPPIGERPPEAKILPGGGQLTCTHDAATARTLGKVDRIIYLVRDGRDVAVSYFHHARNTGWYDGPWDGFLRSFIEGSVDNHGPWADHAERAALTADQRPDGFVIVRYEDLLTDTVNELERLLRFIGIEGGPVPAPQVVERQDRTQMRAKAEDSRLLAAKHADGGRVVRAARSGGWRSVFSPDQAAIFLDAAGDALEAHGYET